MILVGFLPLYALPPEPAGWVSAICMPAVGAAHRADDMRWSQSDISYLNLFPNRKVGSSKEKISEILLRQDIESASS
jgi:hypothetical protein